MNKVEDISGQRYGQLTVVRRDEHAPKGRSKWICKCNCGKMVSVYRSHLVCGQTISCGCASKGVNLRPIDAGTRFGRLTVIEITNKKHRNTYMYKCECDCGNTCFMSRNQLISGGVKSCGCLATERSKKAIISAMQERNKSYVEGTDILSISSKKIRSTNTSGKRGVSWDASVKTWKAYIGFKGKQYYLGSSKDFEKACKMRDEAEKGKYGNFLDWYAENYPEQWERIKNGNKEA